MNTLHRALITLCVMVSLMFVITIAELHYTNTVHHHISLPEIKSASDIFIVKATAKIVQRYRVDTDIAQAVAESASRHQHQTFPTATDIIAIVAIESSFNPNAKSNLKTDPALGLTQIRNVVWKKQIAGDDMSIIDNQIKHSAAILAHYYDRTKDKDAAIMAYNVGITAVLKGRKNENYLMKYNRESIAFSS